MPDIEKSALLKKNDSAGNTYVVHPYTKAENVDYDNTNSGLTSNNVKSAIDELSGHMPPAVNEAHKQLVTDDKGHVKWEDRLAYDTVVEVEYLTNKTLTFSAEGKIYFSTITETLDVSAGDTVIVTWDGVTYTCIVDDAPGMLAFGNLTIAGYPEGEDTGEPFLFGLDDEVWQCGTTEASTEHTISISGNVRRVHKLDAKFLPDVYAPISHVDNDIVHITDIERSKWNTANTKLSSHTNNSSIHVTSSNKTKWDTAVTDLSTHTNNSGIHVTSSNKTKWDTAVTDLSTHTNNSGIHVTTEDKTKWNNHTDNSDIHVTTEDKTKWNDKISINCRSMKMPYIDSWAHSAYGNDKLIALPIQYTTGRALYSDDNANTWNSIDSFPTSFTNNFLDFLYYGGGKFIVKIRDSYTFAYSEDGISWTTGTLPDSGNRAFKAIMKNCITYADGKFVAAFHNTNTIITSEDGITWNSGTLPIKSTWDSIVYGNGRFIILSGSTKSVYSDDGINWTSNDLPTSNSANAILYENNKFVAVGQNGGLYSDDGINWTTATTPVSLTSLGDRLAYGNSMFVTAGLKGTIMYSSDGITWVQAALPITTTSFIYGPIYINNTFIVFVDDSDVILVSNDGITWKNEIVRLQTGSGTDVTDLVKQALDLS